MAEVFFRRGTSSELKNTPKQDGLLSFTINDGKIHLDYYDENNELQRKTFYSGKLTLGPYVFDGSQDVTVKVYNGE